MTSLETWEIFDPPQIDNSTSSFEYIEIRESSNAKPLRQEKLQWKMNDVDAYIMPSGAFLDVQFFVRKADGTALGNRKATLENNAPLFREASLRINDKQIEWIQHLHKKRLVEGLLEYSDDYAKTAGSSEFWFLDTAPRQATFGADGKRFNIIATIAKDDANANANGYLKVDPAANGNFPIIDNVHYNEGFAKRLAITINNQQVCLRIPLARIWNFCKAYRGVSVGSRWEFELIQNRVTEMFYCTIAGGIADDALNFPSIELEKASIYMPYLKPSLATAVRIEQLLAKGGSQVIPFPYAQIHHLPSYTDTTVNWLVTSATESVSYAVFWFQQNIIANGEAGTGLPGASNYAVNKSVFTNVRLTRATLTIGGRKFPQNDMTSDADKNDYVRLYNEYLRVSGKSIHDYNTGSQVSYRDFSTLYPMYCFDLRDSDSVFTPGQVSDLRFQANVTLPAGDAGLTLGNNVSIYCMVVSDRIVKLDVMNRSTYFDVV